MKQETLEEASNKIYPNDGYESEIYDDIGEVFREKWIEGAKQQQEKSYSEEEVFKLLMEFSSRDINSSSGTPHSIAKWFEQFKKK